MGWPRAARALFQKPALALCAPQRIGADHAHAVRVHGAQPLAETFEAAQRAVGGRLIQPPAVAHAGREAHHFAQAVQDDELAVRIPRDDHVKAVGAEIDGGKDVGNHAAAAHLSVQHSYAENEDPQPQVVFAFGLRMTNWAPCRSSL